MKFCSIGGAAYTVMMTARQQKGMQYCSRYGVKPAPGVESNYALAISNYLLLVDSVHMVRRPASPPLP